MLSATTKSEFLLEKRSARLLFLPPCSACFTWTDSLHHHQNHRRAKLRSFGYLLALVLAWMLAAALLVYLLFQHWQTVGVSNTGRLTWLELDLSDCDRSSLADEIAQSLLLPVTESNEISRKWDDFWAWHEDESLQAQRSRRSVAEAAQRVSIKSIAFDVNSIKWISQEQDEAQVSIVFRVMLGISPELEKNWSRGRLRLNVTRNSHQLLDTELCAASDVELQSKAHPSLVRVNDGAASRICDAFFAHTTNGHQESMTELLQVTLSREAFDAEYSPVAAATNEITVSLQWTDDALSPATARRILCTRFSMPRGYTQSMFYE